MSKTWHITNICRSISRHWIYAFISKRYVIGADLRRLSIKAVMLVIKANNARNKVSFLFQLIDVLEEIKVLVKVCKEVKAFNSFKSFGVSVKMTDSVIKQCAGWLKSQRKQPGRNRFVPRGGSSEPR